MSDRKEFPLTATLRDVVIDMSEGNPGALQVLMDLLSDPTGFVLLMTLDDMNIRGTQVWIAFKDYAKEDMAVFIEAIRTRKQEMVDVVNLEGERGNHNQIAVTSGGSYPGGRQTLAVP